jgi:hypothetical protein
MGDEGGNHTAIRLDANRVQVKGIIPIQEYDVPRIEDTSPRDFQMICVGGIGQIRKNR